MSDETAELVGPDFDKGVALVIRVLGQQKLLQLRV